MPCTVTKEKIKRLREREYERQKEAVHFDDIAAVVHYDDRRHNERFSSSRILRWPVPSSRGLNQYYHDGHDGLDINGQYGCSVVATMSGTVVYSRYGDIPETYYGGGNFVVIRHDNGYYSHYAHLDSRTVSEGQWVAQGQVIGKMGSTGVSTGTHLHFAIATRPYGAGGRINTNPGSSIMFIPRSWMCHFPINVASMLLLQLRRLHFLQTTLPMQR